MDIIYGARAGGKTHELVKQWRERGGWFITPHRESVIKNYKLTPEEQARVKRPEPGVLRGTRGGVYVDSLETVLMMLFGGDMPDAVVCSYPPKITAKRLEDNPHVEADWIRRMFVEGRAKE